MIRRLTLAWLGCALLCAAGCGSQVTADRWCAQLKQYVAERCDGDPTGLRSVVDQHGRPMFTVLGATDPNQGVDASGYLVDVVESGGRTWLVYALAQLKNHQVQHLRPAAVTRDERGVRCVVGQQDSATTKHYLKARRDAPSDVEPVRTWPRPGDRFTVSVTDSTLTLTELHSGARWRLALPQ